MINKIWESVNKSKDILTFHKCMSSKKCLNFTKEDKSLVIKVEYQDGNQDQP